MASDQLSDNAATVIIGQKVKAGCEEDFLAWQHDLNHTSSLFPGFIGAEVTPPTAAQPEWVVVYRFDSIANLQAWINSAARQDRLPAGRKYLDGPPTQQVVAGGAKPPEELVTVVVSHRVAPESVDEFLRWQERLRAAEVKFDGFRGSELFRPVDGVQDTWTALYRYDTAAHLEKWLTSEERKKLLAEGKSFQDFQLRTMDNSFGTWFAFDERGPEATPLSDTKTSIAVWVGLYPTVVLLTLALAPLKMPLWLGMLVGNLLSSFVMTFVTMPYYVNRLLGSWLWPPKGARRRRIELRGLATVVAVMVAWTIVFYLVTRVFWTLP